MKKRIKFVYFDVGGVILRWREIFDDMAIMHHRNVDEMLRVFAKYDTEACRGLIHSNQLWKNMCRDLGIKENKSFDFFQFTMDRFKPIPETHQLIKDISKKFPVGLLTNVHPYVFDHALKRKNIPKVDYKIIIQSCLVGMAKPEKGIFHHARQRAKVEHEEILFIDDYEKNINSAKELGWQTIFFETNNPKNSIKNIRQLLGI